MYGLAFTVMEYEASNWRNWAEGLVFSFPFILFILLWSEKISIYFKDDHHQPKNIQFLVDFFLIHYSFIFAFITSLVFQWDNVDAKGWWPIGIIIFEVYALFLGSLFAFISLLLKEEHRQYTYIFGLANFLGYLIISLLPWRFHYLYGFDIWMLYTIGLFIFYLVFCICRLGSNRTVNRLKD